MNDKQVRNIDHKSFKVSSMKIKRFYILKNYKLTLSKTLNIIFFVFPGNLPDKVVTPRGNELERSGLLQKICFLEYSLAPPGASREIAYFKSYFQKTVFRRAQHCQENNFATERAFPWRDVAVTS